MKTGIIRDNNYRCLTKIVCKLLRKAWDVENLEIFEIENDQISMGNVEHRRHSMIFTVQFL